MFLHLASLVRTQHASMVENLWAFVPGFGNCATEQSCNFPEKTSRHSLGMSMLRAPELSNFIRGSGQPLLRDFLDVASLSNLFGLTNL